MKRFALLVGYVVVLAVMAGSGFAGRREGDLLDARTTIRLPGAPVDVAVGAGSVFVLVGSNGDEWLLRIDPVTGAVRSTTRLGSVGSDYGGVAVRGRTIWAAAGTRLFRFDSLGRLTAVVPVGGTATSVFASRSAVWVTRATGRLGELVRVESHANRVLARTDMGGGPDSVVAALGSVWVANSSPASLMRVDPRTNTVAATLHPTTFSGAIAFARGLLWAAGEGLVGLDARGRIVRQIRLPRRVARIAAQGNQLWGIDDCGCATGRLLQIDLRRGGVSHTWIVGKTPVSLAVGYGAAWVANFNDSSLSRIPN